MLPPCTHILKIYCLAAGTVTKASQDGMEKGMSVPFLCLALPAYVLQSRNRYLSSNLTLCEQPTAESGSAAPAAQGAQTVWPSLRDAKEQKVTKKAAPATQGHSDAFDRQVQAIAQCARLACNRPTLQHMHDWAVCLLQGILSFCHLLPVRRYDVSCPFSLRSYGQLIRALH